MLEAPGAEPAFIVAGLGFGDEGKGSVVDWLVRTQAATAVLRYNGGPQAAHHVVLTDGRAHCFSQFGAGTLVPGVATYLSRFMVLDPLALEAEERALRRLGVTDAWPRLTVDPRCIVVTPFHALLNQMQELARGAERHGSCGRGIAQARLDAERGSFPVVRMSDLLALRRLRDHLRLLWRMKLDVAEQLAEAHAERPGMAALIADLRRPERADLLAARYHGLARGARFALRAEARFSGPIVLEGAQGALLDQEHGFWPHVTPSDTTFRWGEDLLRELGLSQVPMRVGVLRAYATRHGAGPLPSEDPALAASCPEAHNGHHAWQGPFRLGWFDAALSRYALQRLERCDQLVLTNLDRLAGLGPLRVGVGYEGDLRIPDDLGRAAAAGLDARAQLTKRLSACVPRYASAEGFDDPGSPAAHAYLELLESGDVLGRRIDVVSVGPTAAHKRVRGRAPVNRLHSTTRTAAILLKVAGPKAPVCRLTSSSPR